MFFLEFFCFFYNSADLVIFFSGSSAFSKSSLYIQKFSVHIMLKLSLKDFEPYLAAAAAKSLQSCLTLCNPIYLASM